MRIYINLTTVEDTAATIVGELVKAELISSAEAAEAVKVEPVTHLANFSVDVLQPANGRPGHVVVEINDEIFFKYARVYAKVIRYAAPFVKPAAKFLAALKEDVQDIERFLLQRK